ncbi:hypothetical protein TcasGA2_TC002902 [Tribolium castaneum]|uniref:Uncharacterized protein n=1 Tax=Tribolium castaneum TaxID=7070 RepID=D6WHH4_TRICA|nr:hypothetical protein TcasGA2_TC002902 [Tribolium castaneum]
MRVSHSVTGPEKSQLTIPSALSLAGLKFQQRKAISATKLLDNLQAPDFSTRSLKLKNPENHSYELSSGRRLSRAFAVASFPSALRFQDFRKHMIKDRSLCTAGISVGRDWVIRVMKTQCRDITLIENSHVPSPDMKGNILQSHQAHLLVHIKIGKCTTPGIYILLIIKKVETFYEDLNRAMNPKRKQGIAETISKRRLEQG